MKPVIEYPDFDKLDLRVGRVVTATLPEWSRKLVELTVDFGEELGQKTIFSGVREWYEPAEFIGNAYIFVVNLAEKKMGEGVSQGMMLMADGEDKPVPLSLPAHIKMGTQVR
jgi:methionine--tRNA ligase beta chain